MAVSRTRTVAVATITALLGALVPANAQFPGQLPAGTVLGNPTASQAPARPFPATAPILIAGGAIKLDNSGVTPGPYTNASITVDAFGRVTAASSGSGACGTLENTGVVFGTGASTCATNAAKFNWDNTNFRLNITALPGATGDDGIGLDLIGGNGTAVGALRQRMSSGGGSLRTGYLDGGNEHSYIQSLDNINNPNKLTLNAGTGGFVVTGADASLSSQPAYSQFISNVSSPSQFAFVWGESLAWRGGVYFDASGIPELQGSNSGATVSMLLSANPSTVSYVPGEFQVGGTLSCNGTNSALQSNGTGKLVCGSITGGGGAVTSVGLSVPGTSIFGVTGSPVTTTGTLGLTTTGTSGGIPYFSSGTQLASSAALPNHALVIGGGAAATPKTIAALTDGQIAIGATGADPAPGTITAGSGITVTNGPGSITIAATATSSPITLVQTQNPSSVAQVDFTGLTGKKYRLVGRLIQPATNGANLQLQFGTGGGPTFSATDYSYSWNYVNNVGTTGHSNSNSDTKFALASSVPNTGGTTTMGGSFTFDIDTDNTTFVTLMGSMESSHTDTTTYTWAGGGRWTIGANQLTGIRVKFDSGNIASGTLSLYAISE